MGLETTPLGVPRTGRAAGSSRAQPWMCRFGGVWGLEGAELRRRWRGALAGLLHPHPTKGRGLWWGGTFREVMAMCLLGALGHRGALPVLEYHEHSRMMPGVDLGCGRARGRADPTSTWETKVT